MKRLLLLSVLLFGVHLLFATHNRAGRISYEQIDQFTIKAVIVTYSRSSSLPADRDALTICWGDGQSEVVPRSNGSGDNLESDFKRNLYTAEHTYTNLGEYIICMTDPNRNSGVLNINPPNSGVVAFHLQATVQLLDLTTTGLNKSPVLQKLPVNLAYAGFPFTYSPMAFDPDGDSIAYELIEPMSDVNTAVPNYLPPNEVEPSGNTTLTLDERTGVLTWDRPEIVGFYTVAILIKSYRNGIRIDDFVLDMEIPVLSEEPPTSTGEFELMENTIHLFPNPTYGQTLRIENLNWKTPTPYIIFDASGKKLSTGQLHDAISEIILPNLIIGTYFLMVRGERAWSRNKFVVME